MRPIAAPSEPSPPLAYFEGLYAADPDPWGFETRWYEQRKHALTVASLPWSRYQNAFEPACGNGRLTRLLAPRCDALLAADGVGSAVRRARRRLRHRPGVQVEQRRLPEEWPADTFDLIVISEFLYYLTPDPLARAIGMIVATLRPQGTLVAVHWRHPVAGYPTSGDAVHRALRSEPGLGILSQHEEEDFLLDVLVRRDGLEPVRSVAATTGVPGSGDAP
ncbi:MAG TPA: SAM-dependent methyltransferase [Candidatus Dormibacteraeota bacterium]